MWKYIVFVVLFIAPSYGNLLEPPKNATNMTLLCLPCRPGSYYSRLCAVPSTRPNNSDTVCPYGWCIAKGLGYLNCTLCKPGSFQHDYYQNKCMNCVPGTYSDEVGSPRCFPCPAGTKCLGEGNTVATECDPGYYCAGGPALPVACPPNSYCKKGCAQCESCVPPFWQSEEGSGDCHVTAVLFIVIVLSALIIGLAGLFIWTTIRKLEYDDEAMKSAEVTSLIPRADGPTYRGL